VRHVEKNVAVVSGSESGFPLEGIVEVHLSALNCQIGRQELAQVRAPNDEAAPVFRKSKAVGALHFVGRKEIFQVSPGISTVKISTPDVDLATGEKESWIRLETHTIFAVKA
jgi:hypothetical protein